MDHLYHTQVVEDRSAAQPSLLLLLSICFLWVGRVGGVTNKANQLMLAITCFLQRDIWGACMGPQ